MEKTLKPSRGVRFAPSPTGRLHVGNLRTAWLSHEWARAWGEPWVVRFEDIDAPRAVPGAMEQQLIDMAALGLVPDEIILQSALHQRHWDTFVRAVSEGRAYPCTCSRKEVREALERAASAPHPVAGAPAPTYSGHCRTALAQGRALHPGELATIAWRFAVQEDVSGCSDFIVARSALDLDAQGRPEDPSSFAPAYHWACSVDDWDGDYRLLVRAWDLAEVLPQHRAIMRWLGESERAGAEAVSSRALPAVFHTALVTQNDGHRLEKRTAGATLSEIAAAGVRVRKLLECFEKSARRDLSELMGLWEPGRVWGERSRVMSLAELGLG